METQQLRLTVAVRRPVAVKQKTVVRGGQYAWGLPKVRDFEIDVYLTTFEGFWWSL